MGLFGNWNKQSKEDDNKNELLIKHDKGEMNDATFLKLFGQEDIYCSTPFGDHKDGGIRLFLLPCSKESGYFPVFTSVERLKEFYEKAGRVHYIFFKGSFVSILESTKEANNGGSPVKMGIIIDPGYFDATVDYSLLDEAISIIKTKQNCFVIDTLKESEKTSLPFIHDEDMMLGKKDLAGNTNSLIQLMIYQEYIWRK